MAIPAIAAYALRSPILTGIAEFLTVEDSLAPADIIFVLTGGPDVRPFRAAELYGQNMAPEIVLPRAATRATEELGLYPNETDATVQLLQKLGVPDRAIRVLETAGGVSSTFDEARTLRRFASAYSFKRVIVVTSAHHTRRARWMLRRQLDGMSVKLAFAPTQHASFNESNWWQDEAGLLSIVNEYIKFAYYWINYRRRPADGIGVR